MRPVEATLYRLFVRRLHAKLNLWTNGRATPGTLGESPDHDPDFDFPHYRGAARLTGSRRVVRHHTVIAQIGKSAGACSVSSSFCS